VIQWFENYESGQIVFDVCSCTKSKNSEKNVSWNENDTDEATSISRASFLLKG
jgi:hypothetical protein